MKRHFLPIALIIIISSAIYANTLKNSFVYDDSVTIVNNTFIKKLNNIPKLVSNDYFLYSSETSYRPVVTFTYFLDYAIFDLKPWGYHLTNLLLHAINCILLYLFLLLLAKQLSIKKLSPVNTILSNLSDNQPLIISLLFATHPILTEAVNAISFREDLLSFFFYMTTLNIYIATTSSSGGRLYPLSCITYALALLSKEMAATLPMIVYLYEWIVSDKESRIAPSFLLNKYIIGYATITLAFLILRFIFHHPSEHITSWQLSERLLTVPWLLLSSLKSAILPFSLSADHVITPVKSLFSPRFIVPLISVTLLIVILIMKRKRELVFGILFFIITLFPVYNIIPIAFPLAERYLYLPTIGFAIIIGHIINNLNRRTRNLYLYHAKHIFFGSNRTESSLGK